MTDLRTQLREDIAEALWGISKEHPEWSDCLNDPHTTAVLEALAPLLAVVEAAERAEASIAGQVVASEGGGYEVTARLWRSLLEALANLHPRESQ